MKLLSLLLLLLAPCAQAAGRFELVGNAYLSRYDVTGFTDKIPSGFVPFGLSVGIKGFLPFIPDSAKCTLQSGELVGALAVCSDAEGYLQVAIPSACMFEATSPPLSRGPFNLSFATGIGIATWGHSPWFCRTVDDCVVELRCYKKSFAYSESVNLDLRLGQVGLLSASIGYMRLGTLRSDVGTFSVGGITFGLGLGCKL
jgi:hypothetical protein